MKTVVGLYDNLTSARNAIQDLVNAGIDRADINLVARDAQDTADTTMAGDTMVDAETGDAAVEGAVAGGVIGGLGGVLLGLGALAIPGIGPVVAAGPLVAGLVGAGLGAATGGLLGALVDWGIPETEAGYYAEGVRRGGTLVAVRVPDMQANEVADIMNRHNPTDVQRRAEAWTASGWSSYDVNTEPYTSDQIAQERSQYAAYDYDEAYEDEFETYEPAFQRDFASNYAATGTPYTRYTPAYRYGYGLATDERYHGREWHELEPEARRDWEAKYDDAWDDFKNAVRRGWEEVKDAFTTEDDMATSEDFAGEDEVSIPVVKEELRVGKQTVDRGGVRVHTHVEEQPVTEDVSLREERVTVQRRPVDRPAGTADIEAFEEGTFEVHETAEEAVAEKRARVVEEVVIDKGVTERTETVRDTVRRTEVDVDDLDTDMGTSGYTFDTYRDTFRRDFDTNYGTTGYTYQHYEPAYRYGYDLGTNTRYRGMNWNEFEPEARRRWEEHNQGTWDQFKNAVRRGWEELKDAFD